MAMTVCRRTILQARHRSSSVAQTRYARCVVSLNSTSCVYHSVLTCKHRHVLIVGMLRLVTIRLRWFPAHRLELSTCRSGMRLVRVAADGSSVMKLTILERSDMKCGGTNVPVPNNQTE